MIKPATRDQHAIPPGPRALAQRLADWRGDAAVLRRRGDVRQAEALERCADEIARDAEDFLVPLNETEALLRCGWKLHKLRWWFRAWEREGYAWEEGDERRYLPCVVPTRARTGSAAAAGAEAAQRHLQRKDTASR